MSSDVGSHVRMSHACLAGAGEQHVGMRGHGVVEHVPKSNAYTYSAGDVDYEVVLHLQLEFLILGNG